MGRATVGRRAETPNSRIRTFVMAFPHPDLKHPDSVFGIRLAVPFPQDGTNVENHLLGGGISSLNWRGFEVSLTA